MLLVCCLCAVYMLFMRWLYAVCVLVVRRKSWTKWGEIVSKPSRRHLGTISKECKRMGIEKTIYNLTPSIAFPRLSPNCVRWFSEGVGELSACVYCCKTSNLKYQISNINVQTSMFNVQSLILYVFL